MLKITKQNDSLLIEGVNNNFYPNDGKIEIPLNSLTVVIDNSDMATFRSVATNDVLFSGLINNITINGEAVTKDNIIEKFDAVSNSSTGGISDEQAQEIAKIPTIEAELAQKANASDVPTVQTGRRGTNKNYVYSDADTSYNNDKVLSSCYFDERATNRLSFKLVYWGDEGYRKDMAVPLATPSTAGIMSGNDKTKLDSISNEWTGTQSEFDALTTKEDNKIYYVTE